MNFWKILLAAAFMAVVTCETAEEQPKPTFKDSLTITKFSDNNNDEDQDVVAPEEEDEFDEPENEEEDEDEESNDVKAAKKKVAKLAKQRCFGKQGVVCSKSVQKDCKNNHCLKYQVCQRCIVQFDPILKERRKCRNIHGKYACKCMVLNCRQYKKFL